MNNTAWVSIRSPGEVQLRLRIGNRRLRQCSRVSKERGITQQEFDAVKQQASEIAKVLGIK